MFLPSLSTYQPLLCKSAEAHVAKWQEQWEATDRNLKLYDIHPKERLLSGHTLPWWMANRVRSGQAAAPAAKHLRGYRESKNCMCSAATCDLSHILMSCKHFGERQSRDDIAKMMERSVRWLSAVADMTWWLFFLVIIIRLRRCSRHCWGHLTPSRGPPFVLVLDVPGGGGGLTPLRRCSRHCWVHLTPSRGPPFVLVLDVPGGGGVNSLKVVFQTLLGSPYAIPWPSICFGLGRPRGGGG